MKNIYKGWYTTSGISSALEQISPRYASRYYGSLIISDTNLIVNFNNATFNLDKGQVKCIQSQFFGRFRIEHTNLEVPQTLVFSAWWPFGLSTKLKVAGYDTV